MMQKGDKIGIVCCSNGQKISYREKIELLHNTLEKIGLVPVFSEYIYEKKMFSVVLSGNVPRH